MSNGVEFDPRIHTEEARAAQIGALMLSGAILIGPDARAPFIGSFTEQIATKQSTLGAGSRLARPIEVIGLPSAVDDEAKPFPVDTLTLRSDRAYLAKEAGRWMLRSMGNDIHIEDYTAEPPYGWEINRAVMGPRIVNQYGRDMLVARPALQLGLIGITGPGKYDDILRRLLSEAMRKGKNREEWSFWGSRAMNPFRELAKINHGTAPPRRPISGFLHDIRPRRHHPDPHAA